MIIIIIIIMLMNIIIIITIITMIIIIIIIIILCLLLLSLLIIFLRRIGKNKAQAHHTSTSQTRVVCQLAAMINEDSSLLSFFFDAWYGSN